ncbi:glutaminase [Rhodococcus sp. NPDC060086]|uniref:glutaminase n=1 Tax=Rhodococcus sp. NPDC060086 TaxID=3347055 RepID=UPI0036652DB6
MQLGHELVRERVGVNNSGAAFNSVIAIELNDGHPMNPMVNAGALATTAAQLLASYGRVALDPDEVVDVYTKQCSLKVDAQDLAVMGATLADGGVNPLTGRRVVPPGKCGIGVFSPLLDSAGNSIRGQRATAYLSRVLGLNIFASAAHSRQKGIRR